MTDISPSNSFFLKSKMALVPRQVCKCHPLMLGKKLSGQTVTLATVAIQHVLVFFNIPAGVHITVSRGQGFLQVGTTEHGTSSNRLHCAHLFDRGMNPQFLKCTGVAANDTLTNEVKAKHKNSLVRSSFRLSWNALNLLTFFTKSHNFPQDK